MAGELDDIRVSTDCPRCGATCVATAAQVRTFGAISCACGALLKITGGLDDIDAVQRLIDEASPPRAAND